jgi:hypothetical protein
LTPVNTQIIPHTPNNQKKEQRCDSIEIIFLLAALLHWTAELYKQETPTIHKKENGEDCQ